MDLILTDLDGTLLDHDNYSWEAARPALDRLRRLSIPCIPVSSKTRAEIEFWRESLGNNHPFISENGGAAFIPNGYFPDEASAARRGAYEIIEWGTPYERLVLDLQRASGATQCRVRGFHDMSTAEVASLCGMPLAQAVLAKQREYDEPFVLLDSDCGDALAEAIIGQNRRLTRGGRFWHILGDNDKAVAVQTLCALFARHYPPLRTIGLGDGWNDAAFLNCVDVPVIIRSPHAAEILALVPRGTVTDSPG
ncbi:MAG: HAD-IIB family hydrolase, partial [Acidobacteria bacterium]|nr:HAD-IIB family hydrolase [Acidobacteriota bacterium]